MEGASPIKIDPRSFHITKSLDSIDLDLHHFKVALAGFDHCGYGTSYDKKLSLKIAYNEWLERATFLSIEKWHRPNTSSGFAAHDNIDNARQSAINEALERDAFLVTWLLKRPVFWNESVLSTSSKERLASFKKKGFDIRLGVLSVVNGRFCKIGVLMPGQASPYKFGFVVSTACSEYEEGSNKSILNELHRAATMIINRRHSKSNYKETSLLKWITYHLEYYLDSNNLGCIKWMLSNSTSQPIEETQVVETKQLVAPYSFPWEVSICYASSPSLQNLYFGAASFNKINRRRLRPFFKVGFKLNKDRHPLP